MHSISSFFFPKGESISIILDFYSRTALVVCRMVFSPMHDISRHLRHGTGIARAIHPKLVIESALYSKEDKLEALPCKDAQGPDFSLPTGCKSRGGFLM